jgi:hypothetical protein
VLSIGVVVRLNKVYHFTDIVFIKRQIGALKGFLSSPPFLYLKLGEEKNDGSGHPVFFKRVAGALSFRGF